MPSDPSSLSSLIPALSALLERAGASPIQLEVALCDTKELAAYKAKVEELEAALEELRKNYNRTEYLYRCEVLVCNQIIDYCAEKKFKLPKRLLKNPVGLS